MFRTGLLLSTAMTAVTLLLSGPAAAQAQTDMHVANHDPNTRFLCTYGQLLASLYYYSESGSGYYSRWRDVAVPVTGHGQKVRRIRVVESGRGRFRVGIYNNTPSGFPGELIADGFASIGTSSCGPVSIRIKPTRLKRNTTYWIKESASDASSDYPEQVYWTADPDAQRKAYVQTHWRHICQDSSCNYHSSYISPWTKQTMGPYLKLR